jgi:hypothetical protein
MYSQALRKSRIQTLIQAIERREQVANEIAEKHTDMQRELLNFCTALEAVCKGRFELAKRALSAAQQLSNEQEHASRQPSDAVIQRKMSM